MNVSRLTSRYRERDDPRSPSIKPTAMARTGGTMIPTPLPGIKPAISAVAIPTIAPISIPVPGPPCAPPRSPTPRPMASPQPTPIHTSWWTPVIAYPKGTTTSATVVAIRTAAQIKRLSIPSFSWETSG